MKSERRHQLEKNELADWIAAKLQEVKPYQNAILGVVLLVAVVLIGYSIYARQAGAAKAAGWDRFHGAFGKANLNPADFEDIAEAYPGTLLAHWANVIAGDLRLAFGCDQLFINKANGNQELRMAIDHYKQVLERSRQPMLRERATFGLARSQESLVQLDEAEKLYAEVTEKWPKGAYAPMAQQRLDDLRQSATGEIYDRFAKFDPKPQYEDAPGTPGERPAFDLGTLPDDGPVFTPELNLELDEKPGAEPPLPTPEPDPAPEQGLAPELDLTPAPLPQQDPAPSE